MICVFTGLPGSGKSLKLASVLVDVLYRNQKYYEKQLRLYQQGKIESEPVKRQLWTNLQFTSKVHEQFPGYIQYWTDLRQLTPLRDVDIAIDEIATYFDARLWETLSLEMRRWLAQHRKFGIEIYGTSQDFAQTDKAFRRLTSQLFYLRKLIGSSDLSPTRPAPKYIWGICTLTELDPTIYDETISKFQRDGLPRFMLITREATEIFDTRAEVKLSNALPLKHIERECENANCTFHKVQHV